MPLKAAREVRRAQGVEEERKEQHEEAQEVVVLQVHGQVALQVVLGVPQEVVLATAGRAMVEAGAQAQGRASNCYPVECDRGGAGREGELSSFDYHWLHLSFERREGSL